MGVAVLNPKDCLRYPLPSRPPKKPSRKPNLKGSNPTGTQQQRRNRSNTTKENTSRPKNASPSIQSAVEKPPARDLVMGQVKILKRGEGFTETSSYTTNRPSDKERKKLGVSIKGPADKPGPDSRYFAGSFVCVPSPPPSSVPIPGFFAKASTNSVRFGNEEATNALLKLLRLDSV
ncbi:hypothetical protein FNV43_RR12242 [Rhamnella rubrinervis]|uniref:Uncharacterized protein n=1 Tax=Rhamnella rubrinervis TaxID=2594499 RepID=A0A8K0H709_9ROSA|nr:hypothetical protein FNV43_RR12242 [Rhamnella rubrinervis]